MQKILVVDDNKDNVVLLERILQKEGFSVLKALDGFNGIELANQETPDLILLDIMMPEIDGIEVCKRLVNSEKTKDIPVILVTAKTSAEDTMEGLQAGAYDYIKKPFEKIDLLARVQSALKFRETQRLLIELEKYKTFAATVSTANHEIKQPLTLISLSTAAIKRELTKEEVSKDFINAKIDLIESAVKDIAMALEKFNSVKKPNIRDYSHNIKMIDLNE